MQISLCAGSWARNGRTGRVFRFRNLEWFAHEGRIILYDYHPLATDSDSPVADMGRGKREMVITADEWRERGMYLRSHKASRAHIVKHWQRQELQEILQAAADIEESVREAKQMGDPASPEMSQYWARHNRKGTPVNTSVDELAGYREALAAIERECQAQGVPIPRNLPTSVAKAWRTRLSL